MTPRERFEKEMCNYDEEQFKQVTSKALKENLGTYVKIEGVAAMIRNLLNELELVDEKLMDFLKYFMKGSPSLRSAAIEYYQVFFNIILTVQDPYAELVVNNDAFVDRQDLRDKLKLFFNCNTHQLLATKGPRYSGRTHSATFVKYIARQEGLTDIVIDMLDNSPGEIIAQIINEMRLPVNDFRDRMAQYAAQTKGFITALKGILPDPPYSQKRWCLIFDHHDRDEVLPETRRLVENLMSEVAKSNLSSNVFIVLLGQGNWDQFPTNLYHQVVDVPAPYIEPTDVERYLAALAKKNNKQLSKEELADRKQEVLNQINLRELGGITTMSDRLRKYFNS